jgi:hypothetical protein
MPKTAATAITVNKVLRQVAKKGGQTTFLFHNNKFKNGKYLLLLCGGSYVNKRRPSIAIGKVYTFFVYVKTIN